MEENQNLDLNQQPTEEFIEEDEGLNINQLVVGTCFHLWAEIQENGENLYLITKVIERTPEKITFEADRIFREWVDFDDPGKFSISKNYEVTITEEEGRFMTLCDPDKFITLFRLLKAQCLPGDGDIVDESIKELYEIEEITLE